MVRLLMFHAPDTRRFAAKLSDDSQPERREAGTEEDAFVFFRLDRCDDFSNNGIL